MPEHKVFVGVCLYEGLFRGGDGLTIKDIDLQLTSLVSSAAGLPIVVAAPIADDKFQSALRVSWSFRNAMRSIARLSDCAALALGCTAAFGRRVKKSKIEKKSKNHFKAD
jgi:hypothetical protein